GRIRIRLHWITSGTSRGLASQRRARRLSTWLSPGSSSTATLAAEVRARDQVRCTYRPCRTSGKSPENSPLKPGDEYKEECTWEKRRTSPEGMSSRVMSQRSWL